MLERKPEYVFFDLDGTLTDPKEGITTSVYKALQSFGIEVKDRDELNKFIGPPLFDSFMEYYHLTESEAREAIEEYRKYFSIKGMFENKVYEEIPELLQRCNENGIQCVVATSKPTVYSKQILEHFHLVNYFTFVSGSNLDGTRVDKAEVIQYALQQLNITDASKVVMVGDRMFDVIGARNCGMDSIGVLYGYGSEEEMIENHATYIVKNVDELGEILGV